MFSTTMPPAADTPSCSSKHGTTMYPCISNLHASNACFDDAHPVDVSQNDVLGIDLLDQGFTSLECWPCTERPIGRNDLRSGRWAGSDRAECELNL